MVVEDPGGRFVERLLGAERTDIISPATAIRIATTANIIVITISYVVFWA